jgi:X-X-X-Leu-X-X-Gly heptad repeat protein
LLKYGVLGLLIERRGYGYELVQRLARRLGSAWQFHPSAVYTALDQLEDSGLISRAGAAGEVAERGSRRGERVVYEPTVRGMEEFRQWFARPSLRVEPIRSEIQLKVALAGPDNLSPLLASIAQEEWIVKRLHQECLAASGDSPAETDRIETDTWSNAASALVNEAAVRRLEGQLAWIDAVRERLQHLSAGELRSGADQLRSGADELRSGADQLRSDTGELRSGAGALGSAGGDRRSVAGV